MSELQVNEHGSPQEGPPSPVARIDVINLSLRALWNYKGSATYKDLATPAGLHPVTVSQALSSARDIGLAEYAGKRGLYAFTGAGKEYARALTGGAESETKERLRRIILTNPRWVGIIAFLRTNQGVPRPAMDLIIDVERKLSKQWGVGMRNNVAQATISILEYADLVKVESGKIVSMLMSDFEGEPAETFRASVRDFSVAPRTMGSWLPNESKSSQKVESPFKPDFAELKDENVMIRIRKDIRSITYARSFLDFVENGIRLSNQSDKISQENVREEANSKN